MSRGADCNLFYKNGIANFMGFPKAIDSWFQNSDNTGFPDRYPNF
jgi:hypothetical protein